jgi:hypothetical protein
MKSGRKYIIIKTIKPERDPKSKKVINWTIIIESSLDCVELLKKNKLVNITKSSPIILKNCSITIDERVSEYFVPYFRFNVYNRTASPARAIVNRFIAKADATGINNEEEG